MTEPEPIQLDDHVRTLIRESGLSDYQIAVACDMTPSWVYLLRNNRIKSPNFRALQCLYEHLTGEPLIQHAKN